MPKIGSLTFQVDMIRGGYSASVYADGSEIIINAILHDRIHDVWVAKILQDGVLVKQGSAVSMTGAIRETLRLHMRSIDRILAALNKLAKDIEADPESNLRDRSASGAVY